MGRKYLAMSEEMESLSSSLSLESVPMILSLLDQGEAIDARQRSNGASLLMLAIRAGLPSFASLLIDRGADINAKSMEGDTPLMNAVQVNDIETVKLLLEQGANPNLRSRSGWSALQWAVLSTNNEEIIERIRQYGGRL
jgi:ankyrin repeat protein